MEMSPHTTITPPVSFDEAWEVLPPPAKVWLAHLYEAERSALAIYPAVHRQ
jgi:hypothetical protein